MWWYYYQDENGNRVSNTTGKTTEEEAEEFILDLLAQDYLKRKAEKDSQLYFGDFVKDFFSWPDCQWIKRQHARGKEFKEITARMRKAHLENHIQDKPSLKIDLFSFYISKPNCQLQKPFSLLFKYL
jgi:hypothetical protein